MNTYRNQVISAAKAYGLGDLCHLFGAGRYAAMLRCRRANMSPAQAAFVVARIKP